MTPEHARLVQQSFRQLRGRADMTGAAFFARLFHAAPRTARLFPSAARGERCKLVAIFAFTIEALDDFELMLPALRVAGSRYRGLGVDPGEFGQFRAALLETLEWALGEGWTPELAAAWDAAYSAIVAAMQATPEETRSAA